MAWGEKDALSVDIFAVEMGLMIPAWHAVVHPNVFRPRPPPHLPPAVGEVLPTVHEAAAPVPEGEPPPAPRGTHAVRPLPQRHRPHPRPGPAVLEDGVHQGQGGHGQGNVTHYRVCVCVWRQALFWGGSLSTS